MELKRFRNLYRWYIIISILLAFLLSLFAIFLDVDYRSVLFPFVIVVIIVNFILMSKWKCPTCRKGLPVGGFSGGLMPDWKVAKCGKCGTKIDVATPEEKLSAEKAQKESVDEK